MLDQIRMAEIEKNAFLSAISGIEGEVYLFGSRLHKEKKGGDIDVLIFSKEDSLKLSMQVTKDFFTKCEEKIDVVVMDKDNLSDVQNAFLNTLTLFRVK